MSDLTYTGVISSFSSLTAVFTGTGTRTVVAGVIPTIFTDDPDVTISAQITLNNTPGSGFTFTLLNNVNRDHPTATLEAVIPAPVGYTSGQVLAVSAQPTFFVNSEIVTGAVMPMTPFTRMVTSSSESSTSASSASASSNLLPVGGSSTSNANTSAATSNASSTPSSGANQTSSSEKGSGGLSTGAKAGIAAGCVVIALLIASFVIFTCYKRRRKNRAPPYAYRDEVHGDKAKGNSFALATSPRMNTTATTNLGTNVPKSLPQPESDQTIARLSNRTLDDIELYVENFYTDRPSSVLGGAAISDLSLFNSPYTGRPLAEIIQTSQTPTVLLKHCIAYYLLQKIHPSHDIALRLLPSEFIVPSKGDSKGLSQLRVVTAHSHPDIDRNEAFLSQRDRATQTIIQQMENAFQPWARGSTQDRAKNLRGILTHISELGMKLFSQPANFEWRWGDKRTSSQGQIVMLPGLDKMTDSQAVPLANPIRLVEPRLGRFA